MSRIRALVAEGADLLSTNGSPWFHTPLHQSAFHGREGNVEVLIELLREKGQLDEAVNKTSNPCGRGPESGPEAGRPIHLARGGGHSGIVHMLERLDDVGTKGESSGPAQNDIGEWTEHENLDMAFQGDVEQIHNWKECYTIDQLKQYAIDKGYSCFSVSDSDFNHASMKKFDYQLTPEKCSPPPGYSCKIYIHYAKKADPDILKTDKKADPDILETAKKMRDEHLNDPKRKHWSALTLGSFPAEEVQWRKIEDDVHKCCRDKAFLRVDA